MQSKKSAASMTEPVTLRGAIMTMIWGVICIAVGLLVWYNVVGNPFDELALIRRAKVAVGILSDTYEDQEGGDERHTYIYDRGIYSFQTPDGKQFLTFMDAPSGELKMQVEVEYLPDDPEVNRVRGEGNVTISSWLLNKVGVGTLFLCMVLAPGVILIRHGIREIKQLRNALRSTRQLVPWAEVNDPIPNGQSRVIIARKGNLLIAQWRLMAVRRNGQTIGTICPNGLLAWDQSPGNINLDIEGRALPLTLESNKTTCIEMSVGFGGVQIRFIDSSTLGQFLSDYTYISYALFCGRV